MAVHINKIHVQNLGPISSFSMTPGIFNLIYGKNEQGKTHLVEFIIRSLFRNTRVWSLRSPIGNGKIHVSGLDEKNIEFFPECREKIDDFWQKSIPGLPPDFSKLLVVKGAEVELLTSEIKTHKGIIKRYLSSQGLLENIEKNISSTIQDSQLQNGTIVAPNRKEKKERDAMEVELNTLGMLIDQIDKGYSGGKRKNLSDHEANLRSRLMQIETARNHLAFCLSQHREKLLEENREIDKEVLQKIKTHIGLIKRKVEEIKRKKKEYQSAHERSFHYTWLKQAVQEYTNLLHRKGKLPRILLPIIGLVFLVGGIFFTIISIPLLVLISLGMAFLMTLLYVLFLPRLTQKAIQSEELNRLHKVFKKRFQTEISDLSTLKERLQDQEGEFNRAKMLQDQLVQDEGDLDLLKSEVSDHFFAITAEHIEPSKWNDTVNSFERKIQKLDAQIREKEISLAQLGVDESDYITEKADVEYSKQEHEEIVQELAAVKMEIEEEHKKLDLLKQRICDQTQDIFTTPWETLIENLRNKREAFLNNYRKLTAEMIGKNRVFQVILELRREEDSKIVKGLQSKDILGHLSCFTGNSYSSINLDGEELIVSSNTNNFALSDLSTGAQEQVLLALRIGFAQKWLHQDSLFLILDDAFQYSDWQRRPWLMDTMVDLAKKGWQIFYFSMDDHIRGLFEKKGKVFKDRMKIVELLN